MKALVLDIECRPSLAYVWSLWPDSISLNQLSEAGQVISFAAKWIGGKRIIFHSDFHDGHEVMVQQAHALLDEADAVIHYNGTAFDMKHLRREFLLAGLNPPSPSQDIDLLLVAKKEFKFLSNKLDHVTRQLGLAGKVSHTGFDLWVQCMANDPKAWAKMRTYNKGDVVITEQLYEKLLPWIRNHPHVGLIDGLGPETCNRCGSDKLQRRGWRHTLTSSYRQYQCQGCGGWIKATSRDNAVKTGGA